MVTVVLCVAEMAAEQGGLTTRNMLRISRYCTSLYWSVTIITTTGYGDILPETLGETCTLRSDHK